MANTYEPGEIPTFQNEELQLFTAWLGQELRKISNAMQAGTDVLFQKTYVAPTKPVDGEIRFADGSSWNPGGGMGLYEYTGAGTNGWRMLASGVQY